MSPSPHHLPVYWALGFSSRLIPLEQWFCGLVKNAEMWFPELLSQNIWQPAPGIGIYLSKASRRCRYTQTWRNLALGDIYAPLKRAILCDRLQHTDSRRCCPCVLKLKDYSPSMSWLWTSPQPQAGYSLTETFIASWTILSHLGVSSHISLSIILLVVHIALTEQL